VIFEQGLEKYLREAISEAKKGIAHKHVNGDCSLDQYEANLLKKLEIDTA
jgi:hypothetical protein